MRAVAAHKLLVALVALACVAAAFTVSEIRTPSYQATAEMLVTPLPQDDTTFLGLPVIRDTGDPTRTVQTAATVLKTIGAAARLAARLPGWTPPRIMSAVTIAPAGESNVLAVTASADSPSVAARVADGYAQAVLAERQAQLGTAISGLLPRLQAQQSTLQGGAAIAATDLASRINQLEAARDGVDPSVSLLQPAGASANPAGATTKVILVLALIAGLALGCAAALLLELLGTHVRDEDEALDVYPLPLLARVPRVSARSPAELTTAPELRDALRSVFVQLTTMGTAGRSLMVTGASEGDGKTTCAAALAMAIAATGREVILMDLDLRHPGALQALGLTGTQPDMAGRALALMSEQPLTSMLVGSFLVEVPDMPNLSVFSLGAGDVRGDPLVAENVGRHLEALLHEATSRADWVVIDSAPVGEVSDALPIATHASDVLLVVRPRHTDRRSLALSRNQLERASVRPQGMIVVDGKRTRRGAYGFPRGGVPGLPPRRARVVARERTRWTEPVSHRRLRA